MGSFRDRVYELDRPADMGIGDRKRMDENEKLRLKLKAARSLKDWAAHTPACKARRIHQSGPSDCDCGLNEALCIFEMAERL